MIRLIFGRVNVEGEIHRPPEELKLSQEEEARYVNEGKAEYINEPEKIKGVGKHARIQGTDGP